MSFYFQFRFYHIHDLNLKVMSKVKFLKEKKKIANIILYINHGLNKEKEIGRKA